jgi:hypothetical protein
MNFLDVAAPFVFSPTGINFIIQHFLVRLLAGNLEQNPELIPILRNKTGV